MSASVMSHGPSIVQVELHSWVVGVLWPTLPFTESSLSSRFRVIDEYAVIGSKL